MVLVPLSVLVVEDFKVTQGNPKKDFLCIDERILKTSDVIIYVILHIVKK